MGIIVLVVAMVTLGDSWRGGIDYNQKTALITTGIYKTGEILALSDLICSLSEWHCCSPSLIQSHIFLHAVMHPPSSNIGRGKVPLQHIWKRIFRISGENEKVFRKACLFKKFKIKPSSEEAYENGEIGKAIIYSISEFPCSVLRRLASSVILDRKHLLVQGHLGEEGM